MQKELRAREKNTKKKELQHKGSVNDSNNNGDLLKLY